MLFTANEQYICLHYYITQQMRRMAQRHHHLRRQGGRRWQSPPLQKTPHTKRGWRSWRRNARKRSREERNWESWCRQPTLGGETGSFMTNQQWTALWKSSPRWRNQHMYVVYHLVSLPPLFGWSFGITPTPIVVYHLVSLLPLIQYD